MDGAHAHLLFNHFPIIGSILSVLVLLAGFIIKKWYCKKNCNGHDRIYCCHDCSCISNR